MYAASLKPPLVAQRRKKVHIWMQRLDLLYGGMRQMIVVVVRDDDEVNDR